MSSLFLNYLKISLSQRKYNLLFNCFSKVYSYPLHYNLQQFNLNYTSITHVNRSYGWFILVDVKIMVYKTHASAVSNLLSKNIKKEKKKHSILIMYIRVRPFFFGNSDSFGILKFLARWDFKKKMFFCLLYFLSQIFLVDFVLFMAIHVVQLNFFLIMSC